MYNLIILLLILLLVAHSTSNVRDHPEHLTHQQQPSSNYEQNLEENSVNILRTRNLVQNARKNNLFSLNSSSNRNNILINNSNSNLNANMDENINEELSVDNNRDFDNQIDEIYDNLNYLITSEK